MRKRNRSITIRLTEEEYNYLEKRIKETGQTKQNFVINAITAAKITTEKEAKELASLNIYLADFIKQMRGIATNINQMAYKVNGYKELPTLEKLNEMQKEINGIREETGSLWQSIRLLISQQSRMVR